MRTLLNRPVRLTSIIILTLVGVGLVWGQISSSQTTNFDWWPIKMPALTGAEGRTVSQIILEYEEWVAWLVLLVALIILVLVSKPARLVLGFAALVTIGAAVLYKPSTVATRVATLFEKIRNPPLPAFVTVNFTEAQVEPVTIHPTQRVAATWATSGREFISFCLVLDTVDQLALSTATSYGSVAHSQGNIIARQEWTPSEAVIAHFTSIGRPLELRVHLRRDAQEPC